MREEGAPGDRYQLLELIGEGGVGRVHRGVDVETGRQVAIKVLRDRSARSLERFAQEARVLADIGHPHVVRYVAHGVAASGEPYLAMEWLVGESLSARLARGRLAVGESLELARRVADALAAAHAIGVVHRDVKPSNLFLVDGAVAEVRVLDFGMAFAGFASGVSRSGGVLGTPGYMAPEQASSDGVRVDARADVFSLGAVLFECLTGARAFPGSHPLAVLAQLLLGEAPRLREHQPAMPAALDALVARLLAREPTSRPADGAAVLVALEALGPSGAGVLHSVPPPPPPTAITGEERRLLAVVAVTLDHPGGSASDFERPALPVASALAAARAVGALEGARVDELGTSALLVTLTGTAGATDQAVRAARCALGLRSVLPRAPIAVAMGHGEAGGRLPVGPVVERAAELLTAEPDAVLRIDDVTQALLDRRFDVRGDERDGWTLWGERAIGGRARVLLGRPSPYLGRDRELRMLRELLLQTLAGDRGAQAAVVTAAPGMGKTRLRHELCKSLRTTLPGLGLATGRADAMSAGSAFGVLASALRQSMGVRQTHDGGYPQASGTLADEGRERIRDQLARFLPVRERRRVSAFLGEMLGLPFADDDHDDLRAARGSATRMAAEIERAFVDFLRGVCAVRPALLVLEDLHWADAASIRLVDQALRDLDDQPFVVLALARPEVHQIFPDLWSKRGVQDIHLGALPRRAARELVTSALETRIGAADAARLVDQAAGNAFYLEELIRGFAAGRGGPLPETVLGMVEARLEALPAAPRRLLRAASVFGRVFPAAGALALLGETDRDEAGQRWLPWLIQSELLVRAEGLRDDEHAFRHGLLREGSYAMLTERDRVLGHRLAAEWMVGAGPVEPDPAGEARAAVIGEHFFRGEQWAAAFTHFDRAGAAADRLHANVETRLHYQRAFEALDRCPDTGEVRRLRVDAVLKMVAVSYGDDPAPNLARLTAAEAVAVALPGAAEPPSDDFRRLAGIRFWLGRCHWYRNEYAQAVDYYQRVLAAARQLGDDDLAALPSGTLGRVLMAQGHVGRAVGFLEPSLAPLERRESWDEWIVNAGFVGVSLSMRGRAVEAVGLGDRVLARARRIESPTSEAIALVLLGGIHVFSGAVTLGRQHFIAGVEAAERAGDRVYEFVARGFVAWADSRLQRHDEAAAGTARARAIMVEMGRRLVFADWFDAFALESAASSGRSDDVLAAAGPAAAAFGAAGSTFAQAITHRAWGLSLANGGAGARAEALAHLQQSERLFDEGEVFVEAERTRRAIAELRGSEPPSRDALGRPAG